MVGGQGGVAAGDGAKVDLGAPNAGDVGLCDQEKIETFFDGNFNLNYQQQQDDFQEQKMEGMCRKEKINSGNSYSSNENDNSGNSLADFSKTIYLKLYFCESALSTCISLKQWWQWLPNSRLSIAAATGSSSKRGVPAGMSLVARTCLPRPTACTTSKQFLALGKNGWGSSSIRRQAGMPRPSWETKFDVRATLCKVF